MNGFVVNQSLTTQNLIAAPDGECQFPRSGHGVEHLAAVVRCIEWHPIDGGEQIAGLEAERLEKRRVIRLRDAVAAEVSVFDDRGCTHQLEQQLRMAEHPAAQHLALILGWRRLSRAR